MRYDRFEPSITDRIKENLILTVGFMVENWRPLAAIAVAASAWLNREQGVELTRKPELIDQIVANSIARCPSQTRFAEKGTYEERLREVLGTGIRSQAFDAFMNKKLTICLEQRIPDFKGHFVQNTFYAAYYYNNGEPILAVRDNGKLAKHTGMLDTDNKERSDETLNLFAYRYLQGEHAPEDTMLAYKEDKSCGKDCTSYYTEWIKASAAQLAKMKAHHGMDVASLKPDAPALKYSPANW